MLHTRCFLLTPAAVSVDVRRRPPSGPRALLLLLAASCLAGTSSSSSLGRLLREGGAEAEALCGGGGCMCGRLEGEPSIVEMVERGERKGKVAVGVQGHLKIRRLEMEVHYVVLLTVAGLCCLISGILHGNEAMSLLFCRHAGAAESFDPLAFFHDPLSNRCAIQHGHPRVCDHPCVARCM